MNGKDSYDLNCIDSITKYITAHLFVDKRTKKKCYEFLKQIKDNCYEQILEVFEKEKHKKVEDRELIEFTCYNQILTKYYIAKYDKTKKKEKQKFVCDGFENYKNAFNKLFYRIAELQFGVPIACRKYNYEHNNNAIERYNGKIKDRIKSIRSGFKSFDDARNFMNLRRVIYNFVNPHQELQERTPAEESGIDLELGRNKLLSLIIYLANR